MSKRRLTVLVAGIVLLAFAAVFFHRPAMPSQWRSLRAGMTHAEVLAVLGSFSHRSDLRNEKGFESVTADTSIHGAPMQIAEVYMPLLDEGTPVWRPVRAESLADSTFRIVADQSYDTAAELWEFPPGSVVRCRPQPLSGGIVLTAFELVHPPAGA